MDFILPSDDLILPVSLRSELKDPWGELLRPETPAYEAFLEKTVPEGTRIISIGDFCSDVLVREAKTKPFLIVTDGQTKRTQLQEWKRYEDYVEQTVKNPAGKITRESFVVLQDILRGSRKTHLLVEGEEDLLVLPVLVLGNEEDIIIYGQPNEGMVIVQITLSKQLKAKKIIAQMEIDKHGN